MNEQFERQLAGFGQLVAEAPGALKFVIGFLKMFPRHTQAYKLGDKLQKILDTLPSQ